MEDWKLQTLINEFEEACQSNPHGIIRAAKLLRRAKSNIPPKDWHQDREIIERLEPIMENGSAAARQCAACVLLDMPIQRLSAMPAQFDIQLHNQEGKEVFRFLWDDPRPNDTQQQHAWMEYVANHQIFLEDQRGKFRG